MEQTTETTKSAVDVAKTVAKVVTKEVAYQAGTHVAALTILGGILYTAHKVQERRANKAKTLTAVSE